MNNKEADHIIINYKPYRGFYDLSEKPKSLTKIEYAKVLKIQGFLAERARNIEYLRKFTPIQYEKSKEISANYQEIVREHWGNKL
ncbi:MAG: hypothetical protein KAW56_07030 [Candidatus Marinimicrobia bacterium]|nr:hypothetical protein [Candidatus Neomarinimicrobiota bacterium]